MKKLFRKNLSVGIIVFLGLAPGYSALAWGDSTNNINNTANATATNTNNIDIRNNNVLSQDLNQETNVPSQPVSPSNGGDGSWWSGAGPNNMDTSGNWVDYSQNSSPANTGVTESTGDWWSGGSLGWENQQDAGWWNNNGADSTYNNGDPGGNWLDYINNPANFASNSAYTGGIVQGNPSNNTTNTSYYQPSNNNQTSYQPSSQNYGYNNQGNLAQGNQVNGSGNNGMFNDLKAQMKDKFVSEASNMIQNFGQHRKKDRGSSVISGNHITVNY
jgi:hypothetical protein